MTATDLTRGTRNENTGTPGGNDRLRNAIAMAVILCAGIAGGVLLSSNFEDRALGYENHAAGYLYESEQAEPAAEPAAALTTVADDNAAATPVCQEYTKLVTIGGESQTIYGTACRQPDGTWDIVQ
jgi:surface antigen